MKLNDVTIKAFYHKCTLISLILCSVLIMISGCSSPTSPKSNLTGRISIEGLTDYSGATVAIYHLATLDTTLVRINQEYPALGVQVNQQTEFDFREKTPIKSASTNADGTFSFSGLKEGTYNVVISKSGYGFKVLTNIELSSGENDLNTASETAIITLYQEITYTGLVTGSHTLLSDHHYIFSGDVNFDPSSSVTVQPGAYLRITPAGSLRFYGLISFQGTLNNMIHITSNDSLIVNSSAKEPNRVVQNYYQMTFEIGASVVNNLLEGCIFTYGDYGLTSKVPCSLKNTIFRSTISSFSANQLDNESIENCIFQNTSSAQSALEMSSVSKVSFLKNIFLNNKVGLYVKMIDTGIIKNNYFIYNSDKAIRIEFNSHPDVSHNTIIGSAFGIYIYQENRFDISFNHIESNIGVHMGGAYVYTPMSNNNLICPLYGVEYWTLGSGKLTTTNNYWGVNNTELIPGKIFDKNDIATNYPFYDLTDYVIVNQPRVSSISSAGVER